MGIPNFADKTIWTGDNLDILRGMNSECVDLIYLDPPFNPTFPIWLNIPLSKSSAFFKPLSICETLAVGMAIITP